MSLVWTYPRLPMLSCDIISAGVADSSGSSKSSSSSPDQRLRELLFALRQGFSGAAWKEGADFGVYYDATAFYSSLQVHTGTCMLNHALVVGCVPFQGWFLPQQQTVLRQPISEAHYAHAPCLPLLPFTQDGRVPRSLAGMFTPGTQTPADARLAERL